MCAMMQKLRVSSIDMKGQHYAGVPKDGQLNRAAGETRLLDPSTLSSRVERGTSQLQ